MDTIIMGNYVGVGYIGVIMGSWKNKWTLLLPFPLRAVRSTSVFSTGRLAFSERSVAPLEHSMSSTRGSGFRVWGLGFRV